MKNKPAKGIAIYQATSLVSIQRHRDAQFGRPLIKQNRSIMRRDSVVAQIATTAAGGIGNCCKNCNSSKRRRTDRTGRGLVN